MTEEDMAVALWDEDRVRRVILRFGRALDTGDWAAYRTCFTDPVNINFRRLTGQDEIRVDPALWTRFAELIQSPVRRHHAYTNWAIDLDADRAHALVYMTARVWKATDLGASHYVEYGWYDVWLERQPGGWLIARIKHDFQWVGGNAGLFGAHAPELAEISGTLFCDTHFEAARAALADGTVPTGKDET